jgi:hypothetical protein
VRCNESVTWKKRLLNIASLLQTPSNYDARFRWAGISEITMRHPRHLDLKIDTIEQGAMLGFALVATGPGFIVATSINKAG